MSKNDEFKLSYNEISVRIFQLISSFKFYLLLFHFMPSFFFILCLIE